VHLLDAASLVLCSGTIRRASVPTTVRAAAAAGFDGVSLYFDEYRAACADGWSDADLCALLDDHGVAVAELDGVMRWLPDDERGPSAAEYVDVAAALGARSITVLEARGRRVGDEIPLEVAAGAFAAVCDRAAVAGLITHLEYFPMSGIPDSRVASAVARGAGRANGGVLCDVWHHARGPDAGRTDLADVPVLAVQVSDVAAVPARDLAFEMMHGRLLPGDGSADLVGLLLALRNQGCMAPLEIEVYSDALAALDPFEAARRAYAALVTLSRSLAAARGTGSPPPATPGTAP
jgi:sugar phosphate isomerase/epimerase